MLNWYVVTQTGKQINGAEKQRETLRLGSFGFELVKVEAERVRKKSKPGSKNNFEIRGQGLHTDWTGQR